MSIIADFDKAFNAALKANPLTNVERNWADVIDTTYEILGKTYDLKVEWVRNAFEEEFEFAVPENKEFDEVKLSFNRVF